MSKYYRLKDFLSDQDKDLIPMTFSEIEKVLEFALPASKQYPAWWSNNPSNNPMTQEWLDAGYETESVNTASGKLVFRRRKVAKTTPGGQHPLFGRLKGMVTIPPGVDLTAPADPELADYIDRKYGAERR